MENFNWPILAPNIASFWKRWHMTLTGWCTSYVYMPIVGATRRLNLATFATFVVIGLWHGTFKSNLPWVLWGMYNGAGMIGYQLRVRPQAILQMGVVQPLDVVRRGDRDDADVREPRRSAGGWPSRATSPRPAGS